MMSKELAEYLAKWRGHTMEIDPPSGISSVIRYTCTHPDCGRSALSVNTGYWYGSALTNDCASKIAGCAPTVGAERGTPGSKEER